MSDTAYIRRNSTKIRLMRLFDSKCQHCGLYLEDKIYLADFHHTNPQNKDADPTIVMGYTFEKAKQEIEKCILLCKNCHCKEHFDADLFNKNKDKIMEVVNSPTPSKVLDTKTTTRNEEVINEVVRLFNEGKLVRRISIILGISRYAVKAILHNKGLYDREDLRKKADELNKVNISKETLEDYINQGLYAKDIADNEGCSRATITSLIKRYGLKLANGHKVSTDKVNEAKRLKAMNIHLSKIAEKMNVHIETVRRWIREPG